MIHARTEPNLALELGEIWRCDGVGRAAPHSEAQTARGGTGLAKTRSGLVVVVQDDAKSSDLDSVTVCPLMEDNHTLAPYGIPVEASKANGLDKHSRLMFDQVATINRERLQERIGAIDGDTLNRFFYDLLAFILPERDAAEDAYREVWTIQDDDDDYARSKPRPAVVVQNVASFGDLDSVTVCLLTTHDAEAFYRIPVVASQVNGLDKRSRLMVDKVTTIERGRLKERIGMVSGDTMEKLYLALLDFMVPEGSTFLSTFFPE